MAFYRSRIAATLLLADIVLAFIPFMAVFWALSKSSTHGGADFALFSDADYLF